MHGEGYEKQTDCKNKAVNGRWAMGDQSRYGPTTGSQILVHQVTNQGKQDTALRMPMFLTSLTKTQAGERWKKQIRLFQPQVVAEIYKIHGEQLKLVNIV